MTAELPIAINVSDELLDQFSALSRVVNKLEAQLNFQTLAANWYGDEENILLISFYIQTGQDFAFQQTQSHEGELTYFADDVFSYHNDPQKQMSCFVAITDSELKLLLAQEKILTGYLQKKMLKVVNLIADKLSLTSI